jgi:hypothetical protein
MMDGSQFDKLIRSLASPRRSVLGGGLALVVSRLGGSGIDAKKKRKHKKPPAPVFNEFGCLDVGRPCRGNSELCCSGVCQGKKPKKGKPDKRVCAAHDAGDCSPQRNRCTVEDPLLSLCNVPSETALCHVTTGNAPFCGDEFGFSETLHCRDCAKDTDCLAFGFASGSACVLFQGGRCDVCANTGGRACLPPGISE